jgi:hypothetical protein
MLSELKNLSTILDLFDTGTLYQYDVSNGIPQKSGWSGYIVAYASSTLGCRTNLNVLINYASSIFSRFGYEQSDIKIALNIKDISSEDLQQIKAVAARSLIAIHKQSSPSLLQCCLETVEKLTSFELLKREFLQLATKPEIVIADQNAETQFLDCHRSGDDDVETQKEKLKKQFELDVGRMQWRFIHQNGDVATAIGEDLVKKALTKILRNQRPQLSEKAMISKFDCIKQFFNQVTGAVLSGQLDLIDSAPEIYKDINRRLIGVKFQELRMENSEERNWWSYNLADINCDIKTDLSEMTYSGTWMIRLEESHRFNPVASVKAKLTIDLFNDRLILCPAYEPIVFEHATVKDLENLNLVFS